jgi:hypothetical protein
MKITVHSPCIANFDFVWNVYGRFTVSRHGSHSQTPSRRLRAGNGACARASTIPSRSSTHVYTVRYAILTSIPSLTMRKLVPVTVVPTQKKRALSAGSQAPLDNEFHMVTERAEVAPVSACKRRRGERWRTGGRLSGKRESLGRSDWCVSNSSVSIFRVD